MSHHSRQILLLLEQLEGLTSLQRTSLIVRFIAITEEFRKRMWFYAWVFHIGRFIVTGGSLVVPALLSIQTPSGSSPQMFWSTWTVSLMVTLSNAILTLFKVEKKYYSIHTCVEQLYTEVWQYIELTGRYSGQLLKGAKDKTPSHKNQYIFLAQAIERIHLRQVQDEYFKVQESAESHSSGHSSSSSSSSNQDSSHSGSKPTFASVSANLEELAKKRAELEREGSDQVFSQVPDIEEQLPLRSTITPPNQATSLSSLPMPTG